MLTDAATVQALAGFKLKATLIDGRSGVFDMLPYLDRPGFAALREPAYFGSVRILHGAVTWPEGEDIAPDTLAAEMQTMASA